MSYYFILNMRGVFSFVENGCFYPKCRIGDDFTLDYSLFRRNSFMVDSNTEYNALRSEILNLISIQNTYIIAMYTITITILGFGLQTQNSFLFLLPYIVLFSFQKEMDI